MNAYTNTTKGNMTGNPAQPMEPATASDEQEMRNKPIDWVEDTIVVNGKTLTILFPEEE